MRRSGILGTLLGALLASAVAAQPDAAGDLTSRMVASRGKGAEAIALYRTGLKDPDPRVRAAAVQLYWAEAGMNGFADLAPLSADPDPRVAQAVILGMLPFSDPRVVEPVRKALRTAPDSTKAQVASAIGDRLDARFIEDLGAMLGEHSAGLRRVAVEAMRSLDRPECLPHLLKATGDADPVVASSAISALAALGDPRALPRIAQLTTAKALEVRASAGEALPALGGTAKYRDALITLVRDPQPAVAIGTLRGVREHYTSDARPVVAAAATSPNARVREAAVLALDDAPPADLVAILPPLFLDRAVDVRAGVVRRAGSAPAPELYDAVVGRAADESPTVRAMVATALADFGTETGAPVLALLAGDADPNVRSAAVAAAGRMPGETTLAILRKSSTDPDDSLRAESVRALAARSEPDARAALRAAAADKSPMVRAAAITELARVRDAKAAELAKAALTDPAESVRVAAQAATTALRGTAPAQKR